MTNTKDEYNEEPVYFCTHCLSLKIVGVEDTDLSYCEECGNTDIMTTSIENWERLYQERYGEKYLNIK